MISKKYLTSLVCLLSLMGTCQLLALQINDSSESYALGPYLEVLDDPSKELSFEQVRSAEYQSKFVSSDAEIPNFGFTGHAYWFRFKVENLSDLDQRWYLGVEYALIDYIDIFMADSPASEQWKRLQAGDRRPYELRQIKHRFFYFDLELDPQVTRYFYMRIQTEGSAQFPIYVKSQRKIASQDHEQQFGQGVFVGLLVIMVLYNLTIYFGSRQVDYLLNAIFVFGLLMFKGTMNGVTNEYLWPESIWWANAVSAISIPFVFFMPNLYAFKFMSIQKYPRLKWGFYVFLGLLGFFTLFSWILPYRLTRIYTMVGMVSTLYLIFASWYCYHKGFKPARFFIISWLALITGSIIYGLQKLGHLEVSFITVYCVEIASVVQTLFTSIGQSDKINEINREIRLAQKKALDAQIETNRVTEMMKEKLEILVEERTADLWAKTKDIQVMMDNLQQGVCTLDENLRIEGEYSLFLENLIGSADLSKKSLDRLLFEHSDLSSAQRSMVATAIRSAIGDYTFNFEANSHVLPTEIASEIDHRKRFLELDWAPIENQDDEVAKVMVAIRDVTELRSIQEEARNREHELRLIGQILKVSASKFQNFINSSLHIIDTARAVVIDGEAKSRWDVILRGVHTIKGNARTYGLEEIAEVVHIAEDFLFSVNRENFPDTVKDQILDRLTMIEKVLEKFQDLNDVRLERKTAGETEATLIEVASFLKKLVRSGKLNNISGVDGHVSSMIKRVENLTNDTFCSALKPLQDSLPSLAKQLGKRKPELVFEGEDFEIEKRIADKYQDIFVHLMRNSIDHAFLAHHEGRIVINIEKERDSWRKISYSDNGRGLYIKKLKTRGIENGLIDDTASDLDIANLIFRSGISCAEQVTDISGRGVGMDAVRSFLEELGGSISIDFLDEPAEEGFRRFCFIIQLPVAESMALDLAS